MFFFQSFVSLPQQFTPNLVKTRLVASLQRLFCDKFVLEVNHIR